MATSNDELATALSRFAGEIGGKIGSVATKLDIFVDEFKRERDGASDHRRALRETIAALSQAVRDLTQEVAIMKPIVEDSRQRALERRGREKLGRWLMAFWMGIAGAVTAVITWGLSHWKGVLIVALLGAALAMPALA